MCVALSVPREGLGGGLADAGRPADEDGDWEVGRGERRIRSVQSQGRREDDR